MSIYNENKFVLERNGYILVKEVHEKQTCYSVYTDFKSIRYDVAAFDFSYFPESERIINNEHQQLQYNNEDEMIKALDDAFENAKFGEHPGNIIEYTYY